MKIFLVSRNKRSGIEEYLASVVIAESPEEAINLIKNRHEGSNFDWIQKNNVTVKEIIPTKAKIVLETFPDWVI